MSDKNERNVASSRGKVECDDDASSAQIEFCPPVVKNVTHPLRYYEFTRDEIKVLEECDKESFYHRCLPFSTVFAAATYAAVKYGLMKKNPHVGALPKVLIAIIFGHAYGRYSYIPLCEARLRQLPNNSYLGKTMRQYHRERK